MHRSMWMDVDGVSTTCPYDESMSEPSVQKVLLLTIFTIKTVATWVLSVYGYIQYVYNIILMSLSLCHFI